MKKACKTPTGWRDLHTPVQQPHPFLGVKSIEALVCTGCGKIVKLVAV